MPQRIKTHRPLAPVLKTHRVRIDEGWYDNARWRALRAAVLRHHPLCSDPRGYHGQDGVAVPATEVHHRIDRRERPDLAYVAANLQPLCASCHNAITRRRQDGQRVTTTSDDV